MCFVSLITVFPTSSLLSNLFINDQVSYFHVINIQIALLIIGVYFETFFFLDSDQLAINNKEY